MVWAMEDMVWVMEVWDMEVMVGTEALGECMAALAVCTEWVDTIRETKRNNFLNLNIFKI